MLVLLLFSGTLFVLIYVEVCWGLINFHRGMQIQHFYTLVSYIS